MGPSSPAAYSEEAPGPVWSHEPYVIDFSGEVAFDTFQVFHPCPKRFHFLIVALRPEPPVDSLHVRLQGDDDRTGLEGCTRGRRRLRNSICCGSSRRRVYRVKATGALVVKDLHGRVVVATASSTGPPPPTLASAT